MNPANCLLPVAIVGIPILWLSVEHALERQRETARRICFEFDLSLAKRRYRERTGCDEAETAQVEQEFRRFFLLLAENPGTQLGLHNGQIDDFWHELICCTALYRGYCVEVAGRFIHHDPQGGSGDGYNRTWWAYYDRFLEAPDARFWPAPEPRERPVAERRTANGWVAGCGGGSSCGGGDGGGSGCCGGGCGGGCGGS